MGYDFMRLNRISKKVGLSATRSLELRIFYLTMNLIIYSILTRPMPILART